MCFIHSFNGVRVSVANPQSLQPFFLKGISKRGRPMRWTVTPFTAVDFGAAADTHVLLLDDRFLSSPDPHFAHGHSEARQHLGTPSGLWRLNTLPRRVDCPAGGLPPCFVSWPLGTRSPMALEQAAFCSSEEWSLVLSAEERVRLPLFLKKLFIYLAMPGLSCGAWDLPSCGTRDLFFFFLQMWYMISFYSSACRI